MNDKEFRNTDAILAISVLAIAVVHIARAAEKFRETAQKLPGGVPSTLMRAKERFFSQSQTRPLDTP